MNLSEFKAWFEGFTENLSGDRPTEKQWKRITAKIKEIKAEPTSHAVFIDRYVRPYYDWYRPMWLSGGGLSGTVAGTAVPAVGSNGQFAAGGDPGSAGWNSYDAFRDLGRAEANEVTQ